MTKKIMVLLTMLALLVTFVVAGGSSTVNAAEPVPGDSPENPILVTDPSEVPEGAVEDEVSTYSTPENACDTTRSWVLTVPANEETSHEEFRYLRVIPGAYHEAVTHEEFRYQRTVPGEHHDAVTHTEYHFSKFTQTRTRTYTEPVAAVVGPWWIWSPNDTHGPQDYTPAFPTDPRGTWRGPRTNGGPIPDAEGTYQTGDNGRSNWFHRGAGTAAVPGGWSEWSAYGPWTQWTPPTPTHESWELSTDPLGSPKFHGSGTYNDGTQWERVWQARFDGATKTVTDKEAYDDEPTTETSGWLTSPPEGEGWEVIETKTVTDAAAYTDPDATVYYVLGGEPSSNADDASWVTEEQAPGEGWTQFDQRTVYHQDGTPEVVTYYAYTDGAVCEEPPVDNPPVDNPPVDNPPVVVINPPVDNPPVDNPPVDNPPVVVINPPVVVINNPPADNPPVVVPTSINAGL